MFSYVQNSFIMMLQVKFSNKIKIYLFPENQTQWEFIIIMLNIENDSVLQGEPSIKNAHSATHLRIYNNDLVLVCMDQSIYLYSLSKIAHKSASLVSIIQLEKVFADFQKEQYEDFVTSIFRNAEKEDFSSQIFSKSGDTKSNALLKIQSIKDRIVFFNNCTIRVVKFQLNPKGEILILLADGRAVVIQNCETQQQIINLNEISKEKIRQACFVQPNSLCLVTNNKIIYIADLKDKAKLVTFKINIQNIFTLHGRISVRDRVQLCISTSKQLHILELKKKILSTNIIKFDDYITQTFYFKRHMFISTLKSLEKLDLDTLIREVVHTFATPTELLYVDRFGSFIPKAHSNSKEALWLVDSTTNGVFVGQTIRRNGNYKEGRLLIFEPQLPYFLKRLIHSIRDNQNSINIKDAIFVNMTVQNKALLQQIINLSKSNSLLYQDTELSPEQYNALCINITHAFEGKQLVKQRIIERALKLRFESIQQSSKKYDLRCCFTGKQLNDEILSHCQRCNLYGVESEGDRCVVCRGQMVRYE